MAHWRKRYVEPQMRSALHWAPCIVLLGMRQTGKTSLIKRLATKYLTFDEEALPGQFMREGNLILQEGPFPLALDEAQKYSPLFNLLKLNIDKKKTPGRYVVTGSVRFSQKRDIRESLTGRTAPFELFPLSIAESHQKSPSEWGNILLNHSLETVILRLEKKNWASISIIEDYKETGGLPGICFKRDSKIRSRLFEQQLDTLLGRDLYLLSETKLSYETLKRLLTLIYGSQGTPFSLANLGREVGLSAPSVAKYLRLFEGLYLIRKHHDYYFAEDQGLANYCAQVIKPSFISSWYGLLFHELRCQISAHFFGSTFSSYRSRGGSDVPFLITVPKQGGIGITLDIQERPTEKSLRSLHSLSKKMGSQYKLVALHLGKNAFIANHNILCLPLHWVI